MSDPFVAEIRMFAGNFAPQSWAFCNGNLQPISQNEALFQLIGTTYGGDGQSTFGLPNLAGRVPVHQGNSNFGQTFVMGQMSGTESVTLLSTNIPSHTHALLVADAPGHLSDPANAFVAQDRDFPAFDGTAGVGSMAATSTSSAGGSQPHPNLPPFLCVSFIISLFGIFPSQN
jgi:microcystin-dependent protein